LFLSLSVILIPYSGSSIKAQKSTQKEIGDLFSAKDTAVTAEPELHKLYLPVLPIVGYAPANGFLIGAGIAGSILLEKSERSHISSGLANILFTSKHR
jgi:hypothetical protein